MNPDFIKKYSVPGPRYTSYPTAVQFREVNPADWTTNLFHGNRDSRDISLYFHIPFCFSLCWFCGCTKVITKDGGRGDVYLHFLEKEMDLVKSYLRDDSRVTQIHFGGGSPTFLDALQLTRLGMAIRKRFTIDDNVEFSVELDPRSCNEEQIEALRHMGCNRASLGIQDTNPDVQKAIHRIQPFEQSERVTTWLREHGFEGFNVDLIYGLPKQSTETFGRTVDEVLQLDPDRLAVYSYAHLPGLMPAQKLLNSDDLPSPDEKLNMLSWIVGALPSFGYQFIGMDHFAKEGDALVRAMENGTMHRNFQGYSTQSDVDMIAFGMSGISLTGQTYSQNTKDLHKYYYLLDMNQLPVEKWLDLSEDDRIRRDLIMQIMCRSTVEFRPFSGKWGIDFHSYFNSEIELLDPFEKDDLIRRSEEGFEITEQGRFFRRNIAMVFDAWLTSSGRNTNFSQTV